LVRGSPSKGIVVGRLEKDATGGEVGGRYGNDHGDSSFCKDGRRQSHQHKGAKRAPVDPIEKRHLAGRGGGLIDY